MQHSATLRQGNHKENNLGLFENHLFRLKYKIKKTDENE